MRGRAKTAKRGPSKLGRMMCTVVATSALISFAMVSLNALGFGLWAGLYVNRNVESLQQRYEMEIYAAESVVAGDVVAIGEQGGLIKGFFTHPWKESELTGDVVALADGAFGQIGDLAVFLGGSLDGTTSETTDVYHLDLTTLVMELINTTGVAPITPVGPPLSSADPDTDTIWFYGGLTRDGGPVYSDNLFSYDVPSRTWSYHNTSAGNVTDTPGDLVGGGALIHEGYLWVFGGYDGSLAAYQNAMWKIDISDPTTGWVEVTPNNAPPSTRSHVIWLAYGSERGILFGGTPDGTTHRNDAWSYDFAANTWTELVPHDGRFPTPLAQAGARGVIVDNYFFVYGGATNTDVLDELWGLDLVHVRWKRLDAAGPEPHYRNYALVRPETREIAFYGGFTAIDSANTDAFFYFASPRPPIGVVVHPKAVPAGRMATVQRYGAINLAAAIAGTVLAEGLPVYVESDGNITQVPFQPFSYHIGVAINSTAVALAL